MHILNLLEQAAINQPDAIAFCYATPKKNKSITYAELYNATQTMAAELQKKYATGSRIILIYPPGLDFIVALFACIYSGIIAVPVYPPDLRKSQHTLSIIRLIKIIENSQPQAILTTAAMSLLLKKTKLSTILTSKIKKIWFKAISELSIDNLFFKTPIETYKSNFKQPTATLKPQANRCAYLQYTSGSTGDPKGVMISHENIFNNVSNILNKIQHSTVRIDSAVHWLPLYHDMGLINSIFLPLAHTIPSTITSPLEFLKNPVFWLELISANKNVYSGGPDFCYALCTRKINPNDSKNLKLENWALAYSGAETVRTQTIETFIEKFSKFGLKKSALVPCYGLAEATLYVSSILSGTTYTQHQFTKTATDRFELADEKSTSTINSVSVGTEFKDHKCIIVDPESKRIQPDAQLGELWLQGPSVAMGYWRNPSLSQKIFSATTQDAPGEFLRTGDLAFIYNQELYIYSRIKDLIIINGKNIPPQDIEWCIQQYCDCIKPAGITAFTIDNDNKTELVIAAELREKKLANQELVNTIRGVVSRECGLNASKILLLNPGQLPRTSSGKIRRQQCAKDYLSGKLISLTP